MSIFCSFFHFFTDQSTPKKWGFWETVPSLWCFRRLFPPYPLTCIDLRHLSHSRRLHVNRFGPHLLFCAQVTNNRDFGKNGSFWGTRPPKIGLIRICICGGSNTHGNTSFDVSTTEIGQYLLVDIGSDEEKKGET